MKDKILLVAISLLLVTAILAVIPLASSEVYFIPNITARNISTSLFINVSFTNATDAETPTTSGSASACYYKSASGASWTAFSETPTIINKATTNSSMYVTLTLTSAMDMSNGYINCTVGNRTTLQNSTVMRITLDSTKPAIVPVIDEDSINVGGTLHYSTPITDALSGVKSTNCNLTGPESTVASVSANVLNTAYATSRLTDAGTWTLLCTAGDYAGNNQSASVSIKSRATGYATDLNGQNVNITGTGSNLTTIIIVIIVIAGIALFVRSRK